MYIDCTNLGAVDDNVVAGSNVEAIGVVAKAASVTSGRVNGHVSDGQSIAAGNADSLNRSVLDGDASDGRACQAVKREELPWSALFGAQDRGASHAFGLVLPPLPPSPSHQRAPSGLRTAPEAALTVILLPPMFRRGPAHSL